MCVGRSAARSCAGLNRQLLGLDRVSGHYGIRPPDKWPPRKKGEFRLDVTQLLRGDCCQGEELQLEKDAKKHAGRSQVRICRLDGTSLGWLSSELAEFVADELEAGAEYSVAVIEVRESPDKRSREVDLMMTQTKEPATGQ